MKSDTPFLLESAGWPVLLVNESGGITRANDAAVKTFGLMREGGATLAATIWSPENSATAEAFLHQAFRGAGVPEVLRVRTKGGGTAAFQVSACLCGEGGPRGVVLQFLGPPPAAVASPLPLPPKTNPGVDVGQAHKQKLDCALQLIRTVSLDFNNALTSILGHVSLILSRIEQDHLWRSSLLEIEKSAEKAAEIAADLAAFSRQEKESKGPSSGNFNDVVRQSIHVLQNPSHQRIELECEFETRIYSSAFDEAKMQQALLKIVENAIQAMPAGGKITVKTRNCDFQDATQDGNCRLEPGSYVCVEFADSGPGIPAEVLPRVFEPFFTTKDRARHRGLGLAWVYGIVTNHGGGVAVSSEPGRGASVRVYLPAERRVVRDEPVSEHELVGTDTILMIDDEELLLTMGETVLSAYGYRVLTANSGARGLEVFLASPGQIDLVITDLVMPQMGGRELIERLRRIAPGVRVICTSGFVRGGAQDESLYLQKPFTSQDLLRKVRQALAPEALAA